VFPHPLSVNGLNEALKDIADVRLRRNPDLEVLGVLLTAVDRRTTLWREVRYLIDATLPGRGFSTAISQSVDIAKIAGQGRSLFQTRHSERFEAVLQYRALAQEILQRTTRREEFISCNSTDQGVRGEQAV
jgi:cellulose biosynthesis protein BcsQ